MKRLLSLTCLVALLALCMGGAAVGASTFDTRLTISFSRASGGQFSGEVKSPKHACFAGREVTVYRKRQGRDRAIGSDASNRSGTWKLNPAGQVRAGDYYAKAPSLRLRSGVGTCARAKSITTHAS